MLTALSRLLEQGIALVLITGQSSKDVDTKALKRASGDAVQLRLDGVDHTARPTWKLRETVEFYRDVLGLPLVHTISARGWGQPRHPNFPHFFFDAGKGATIAFFYYIGTDRPEKYVPEHHYFYAATHTAWSVPTEEELKRWKETLESRGLTVSPYTRHEILESIYFRDPNGYPIEITLRLRDVFVVPTIGFDQLYAFIIVRLDRQDLAWINVTTNATAEWVARQLTEACPWDGAPGYMIRDRDRIYGTVVIRRLRAMGIQDRPMAPASPWQNSFAERLIGSIRRECLDHIIVLGAAHLRRILKSYALYYNETRTHLALEKDAPVSRPVQRTGGISSHAILGGLHHHYARV
jgi:catechol 2,3-dioxygenase-like lactoylglutathione lyase family enzyme